jgi:cyclopropane fatty-acyl-phospholipid synthase-like methyltransferase
LLDYVTAGNTVSLSRLTQDKPWDIIVLDRKASSLQDIAVLAPFGCLVGLDEGGAARTFLPYLIDTLPGQGRRSSADKANVTSLNFLDLPKRSIKSSAGCFRNVLISFGGEDPAHLTEAMISCLARYGIPSDSEVLKGCRISVVEGPAYGSRNWRLEEFDLKIRLIRVPDNLKDCLHEYDLVITSFGLTCFEALAAGIPVILLNPTAYHRYLSRKYELPEIGVKKPSRAKLRHFLKDIPRLYGAVDRVQNELEKADMTLAGHIESLKPVESRDRQASGWSVNKCPVCNSRNNPAAARFPYRSYFRCRDCGILYLKNFSGKAALYDESYFTEEYKKQYGRTYLEDFRKIKDLSLRRLDSIRRMLRKESGKSLLDVGCAYGPFLQAASEQGFSTLGVDVSRKAVDFVLEELGIPCLRAAFEDYGGGEVDVLTMWFVIEHFSNPEGVLEKVNSLLPIGGLFAFSTPTARGISGRKNLESFLEESPVDHNTIWSPGTARKILRRFGFSVRSVRITGHHPERFPCMKKTRKNRFRQSFLRAVSRIFGLGDTFEVYSVKVREMRDSRMRYGRE